MESSRRAANLSSSSWPKTRKSLAFSGDFPTEPRSICEVKPCSFDGVYQPSLLDTFPRGQFLALSYFTDRIKPLLTHTSTSTLTIGDLKSIAQDVCAGPASWKKRWGQDKAAMGELEGRPEYCLDLTFMHALLGLGYELADGRELMVEKKLRGVELGWALGAGLALVQNAKLTCTA
jgi:guanosine-diphosphatase